MSKNFENYSINEYKKDLDDYGLEKTWSLILEFCLNNKNIPDILDTRNFGELYEIGLAHTNKIAKKEMGKYYTPEDVATLMSQWLEPLKGKNICDVCCGTGNLILAYFNVIGPRRTKNILKNKRLYLYDTDEIALKICRYTIAILYGKEYLENINYLVKDFLDSSVELPGDAKVISNPPYFKISKIEDNWVKTENIIKSKELYSAIMEKIINQSVSSVVITPYSFIGGEKFYPLRQILNNNSGFIVSFDNVPGSIFNGRKHGIFNTNSSNSVRAAITVTNKEKTKGYRISPLIRFKSEERDEILNTEVLEAMLPKIRQTVCGEFKSYYKCFPQLEKLFISWNQVSNKKLRDLVSKKETEYKLCIPNTCRYFTTAAKKDLSRTGKHELFFRNEKDYYLSYCLINSSFAYWHWRLYDGGITYPLGLLQSMPIFFDSMSEENKEKLISVAKEMQEKENEFLTYKKNAAEMQENIKFPAAYRNKINSILLEALNINNPDIFDIIHSNSFFRKEEDQDDE